MRGNGARQETEAWLPRPRGLLGAPAGGGGGLGHRPPQEAFSGTCPRPWGRTACDIPCGRALGFGSPFRCARPPL